MPGVCVLMYHDIYETELRKDGKVDNYSVSFKSFKSQIEKILEMGYEISPVSNIFNSNSSSSVAVTFDDGHISDYLFASSYLAEKDCFADFFVNTATIGTSKYVSWDNLSEMLSLGMSIQSHSHDHQYLTSFTEKELRYQLQFSKNLLEDKLGAEVSVLSAPGGRINNKIRNIGYEIGYKLICDSRVGVWNEKSKSVPRVPIYNETDLDTFIDIISCSKKYYLPSSVKYHIKAIVKKLTGDRVYEKIRLKMVG